PLLSLLLPLKAEVIAPDDKLFLLSITLLAGATMASIANIWGGAISDKMFARTASRTEQMVVSLILILFSYFMFWKANDWVSLLLSILFFQLSFNFLFAPLGALLADHVPDRTKGRAAALLNLGTPIATLSIALLSVPALAGEDVRLSFISLTVFLMILPLVMFVKRAKMTAVSRPEVISPAPVEGSNQNDFVWAWLARLFVQFSGAVMFGYLLYFLQDIVDYTKLFPDQSVDQGMGKLSLAATPVTIVMGILAGMISDKMGLRRPFLIVSALMIAAAIFSMSLYPTWTLVFATYVAFICGLTTFLTTDAALVAQLLSGDQYRARKLGFMNLTNTIPAILVPATALALSGSGLQAESLVYLMQLAAILAICAAFAASRIRTVA
ncbi:MAG: MFS transporter, partial [Pseudomonadota bacterium]